MKNIAIVVVAFNREKSLTRLLNSLNNLIVEESDEIPLYISIDKSKDENIENQKVVRIASDFEWKFGEKIVDYKKENRGLRKHILECGNLTNIYDNIIVLEDDIVVSPLMYIYSKQVIEFYKEDKNIAGFGLYSFQRNPINNLPFYPINNGTDIYFMQYACSWGQIWTKDRWNDFYNWYKENENRDFSQCIGIPYNVKQWGGNSWLKFHVIYTILKDKYFVYPQVGLTTNFTDGGTHNKISSLAYQCETYFGNNKDIKFKFIPFNMANNVYDAFFENGVLNKLVDYDINIISDLYGEKQEEYIQEQEGYLLSTNKYNYKILKKYSLQMYPYEMNIINNIVGEDIFLYDKTVSEENRGKNGRIKILRYIYKLDLLSKKDIASITKYFIENMIGRILRRVKRK